MTQRVAAYCRVSTDKNDQQNSFESQKAFFREYVRSRPEWTLKDVYADEGITGTSAYRRAGFLSMIGDAMSAQIDLIVTKEVSRFSRNILDAVYFTRMLKNAGVGVIFLNDGICTLDPDAELRLGIMASVAQEESRKTSQRVKWGQRRSMERGVVFGRDLLGYDVKNGKIVIEPDGAEIVRSIYAMYVYEKMGARAIAGALTRCGVSTKSGRCEWSPATILKIIKNEKYSGDLIQRKTVISDYLTHKKTVNRDEAALIKINDHHEAIIEKPLWEAAQAERRRRSASGGSPNGHGNRYPLSGKIRCSGCGAVYTCRTRTRQNGSVYRTWCGGSCKCFERNVNIREESITDAIKKIVAFLEENGAFDAILERIKRLETAGKASKASVQEKIHDLEQRKLSLINAYIAGDIDTDAYQTLKNRLDGALACRREALSAPNGGSLPEKTEKIVRAAALLSSGQEAEQRFYQSLVEKIDVRGPRELDVLLKKDSGHWNLTYTS